MKKNWYFENEILDVLKAKKRNYCYYVASGDFTRSGTGNFDGVYYLTKAEALKAFRKEKQYFKSYEKSNLYTYDVTLDKVFFDEDGFVEDARSETIDYWSKQYERTW